MMMLATSPSCRRALTGSDFAIVDSAYLAALWFLKTGRRLHRVSGFELMRAFVASGVARSRGALFLVNPSDTDRDYNLELLRREGFEIDVEHCYTAPMYDAVHIVDEELLRRLEAVRPAYVMLNVGGGVQEPLGLYLKEKLSFLPGIMCTGAAIAFLTGRQASIPTVADRLGLGWFMRCLSDPKRFVPRYVSSLGLARLVAQFGSELPPPVG